MPTTFTQLNETKKCDTASGFNSFFEMVSASGTKLYLWMRYGFM